MKKYIITFLILLLPVFGWCGVDFDGADDFLENTDIPRTTGDFTLYCMAKMDITGSNSSLIIGTRETGALNRGYGFKVEQWFNTGFVGFTFYGVADYTTSIVPPTGFEAYVAVHDDSANTIDIYVGSSSEQLSVGTVNGTSTDGYIIAAAKLNSAVQGFGTGIISECAVWHSVLTAAEINNLLNSNTRRMPCQIQSSNRQFYIEMSEISDGTSADGVTFRDSCGSSSFSGNDGANNTGLTAVAEEVLTYP